MSIHRRVLVLWLAAVFLLSQLSSPALLNSSSILAFAHSGIDTPIAFIGKGTDHSWRLPPVQDEIERGLIAYVGLDNNIWVILSDGTGQALPELHPGVSQGSF